MKKLILLTCALVGFVAAMNAESCIKTVTSDKQEVIYSLATVQRITFDQNNGERSMRVQFNNGDADKAEVKTVIFVDATPTEVAEFVGNDVKYYVFPNPVQQTLTLKGADKGTPVIVYDLTGRVCMRAEVSDENGLQLNVSGLSSGQYIIRAGITALHFVKK